MSFCVFVSVCLLATVLAATYLVYVSKVRRYTVSCRLSKIIMYYVDFAENISFGRYGIICLATMIGDSALSRQKTH